MSDAQQLYARSSEEMKKVTIREMKPKEYPLLQDFLYDAIYVPEGAAPPPREILRQPQLAAYVQDFGRPGDCCLAAECQGRLIGAVWTRTGAKGYGYLDESTPEFAISVKKDFRRRGIGRKLMEEMIQLLRRRGYKKASLSVSKENHGASRMYRKLGFRTAPAGENGQGAQGDDFMVLDLNGVSS